MADTTLHTYELTCPDPDCDEEFDVERSPAALVDGGELIQCPGCGEFWEWGYDEANDTLELFDDAEFEEDDEESTALDDDEEDSDA